MKPVVMIACLLLITPLLRAGEITLPAKLADYEAYLERELARPADSLNDEGEIMVTLAAGDDGVVIKQYHMLIPAGSTASAAASMCRKENGDLLIGWAQGLVVIRRKTGTIITRITWSQHQARKEASQFVLQNRDVIIGLSYGDI